MPIEVIHFEYYKWSKEQINISTMKAKYNKLIQERRIINKAKYISVSKFEKILCEMLKDIFESGKVNFIKKHIIIRRIYEKHRNKNKVVRTIFEIYMDNTLLAFIKQTIEAEDGFINVLEELLSETEENKRRCRAEVDDLFEQCINFANKGGEL